MFFSLDRSNAPLNGTSWQTCSEHRRRPSYSAHNSPWCMEPSWIVAYLHQIGPCLFIYDFIFALLAEKRWGLAPRPAPVGQTIDFQRCSKQLRTLTQMTLSRDDSHGDSVGLSHLHNCSDKNTTSKPRYEMTENHDNEHGAATRLSSPFSKSTKLPSMLHAISKTPADSPLSEETNTSITATSGTEEKTTSDDNAAEGPVTATNASAASVAPDNQPTGSSFTPQNAKPTTPLASKQTQAQPTSPDNTEDKKKGGVTQSIREKLNFQDEKLWKRFSSRRLDLIDSMALSSKKASEQDVEISNVANTLREEYGYPPETAADFDRLVRAGIQSVRRNRKRVPRFKRSSHVVSQGHHPQRVNFLAAMAGPMHPHHGSPAHAADNGHNGVATPPPAMSPVKRHRSEEDASVALQSLRYQQQAHGPTTLPSVTSLSLGIPAEHLKIACDRFLSFVARSHSGKEPPSSNLEALGRGVLESAVAFMLERHQPKDKHDSLREKLLSEPTTAHVVQTLNLRPQPAPGTSSASPFFHNLIGGCAKDFGFDAIVHALGNIYLELVPQYVGPVAGRAPVTSHTPHSAPPPRYGPTLPGYKSVTFRFMDKKMDFSFSVNETPPTLYELLENGIKTFHIMVEDKVLHIRSHEDRELVKSDYDVKMVFSRPSVDVEFFFPLLPTPNATNMRYMDSPSFQKLL
ncbi:YALI0A07843p [Yarrowia lipolytica CLIB122]|uniref:YALI0A07843p n=2 Tax=Yarrowia lipolytica TaxID=4952 RepID=Q6CHK6_YARLI|nr:YALI0A07843p [Yarrowia lipolytica CLIB122]AOW00374.1 hypothetical protein YALI1_A07381g [Yarrowia lipolytica]KAB8281761.1 transcription factor Vhr1-domain-containing protein [Yarrowia lipolytica]KAE8170398.1 transcription factor Vhr1-domain-containing protein [Yarrowia lipolytica]KAJ8051458.1 transcription factor Vhr1-domain-containing protein [Yarrowia lipolytica]RMI97135.1 transcription factor Vhr1-domain-containing protein [Yarrowia lipolytica]|eukprot:XP_499855.1 YALI0A07843p [Yarrowia lipolytica CLIB122]